MVSSLNSISTKTTGWHSKCWKWAENNQMFEIRDLTSRDFMFCQEVCAEYSYTYQYRCSPSESTARFKPLA